MSSAVPSNQRHYGVDARLLNWTRITRTNVDTRATTMADDWIGRSTNQAIFAFLRALRAISR